MKFLADENIPLSVCETLKEAKINDIKHSLSDEDIANLSEKQEKNNYYI